MNVYGRDGTKLGSIERLMLDKVSGTVAYAVIKTGGLLGSHHHCPIRWDALRFDSARQAYQSDVTPEDLRAARPSSMKRLLIGVIVRGRIRIIGRCRASAAVRM